MKNTIKTTLVAIAALATTSTFAQIFSMNGSYGIQGKTVSVDLTYTTKSNFILGGGFNINMGKTGVGTDYSEVMGKPYDGEIYEVNKAVTAGGYLIGGYKVKQLSIMLKGGGVSVDEYLNAYDPSQILDPSGYYYTVGKSSFKPLYGGQVSYHTGMISPLAGWTNIDGVTLGIVFTLPIRK